MRILFMGTPEFAVPCFDVLNSKYGKNILAKIHSFIVVFIF